MNSPARSLICNALMSPFHFPMSLQIWAATHINLHEFWLLFGVIAELNLFSHCPFIVPCDPWDWICPSSLFSGRVTATSRSWALQQEVVRLSPLQFRSGSCLFPFILVLLSDMELSILRV